MSPESLGCWFSMSWEVERPEKLSCWFTVHWEVERPGKAIWRLQKAGWPQLTMGVLHTVVRFRGYSKATPRAGKWQPQRAQGVWALLYPQGTVRWVADKNLTWTAVSVTRRLASNVCRHSEKQVPRRCTSELRGLHSGRGVSPHGRHKRGSLLSALGHSLAVCCWRLQLLAILFCFHCHHCQMAPFAWKTALTAMAPNPPFQSVHCTQQNSLFKNPHGLLSSVPRPDVVKGKSQFSSVVVWPPHNR